MKDSQHKSPESNTDQSILPAKVPEDQDQWSQGLLNYMASGQTINLVEAERRRLSTLLQANIIERLNLLLAQTRVYEQALADNPKALMAISVITTLTRQLAQEARDLAQNLHPTTLETFGLEPALAGLASQMQRTYGLTVSLNAQPLPDRLPAQIELALYRAVQDGLDRALRQAQASQVTIDLSKVDHLLRLQVTDNGTHQADTASLRPTQLWLEQLGGQVDIVTLENGGLSLTIQFIHHEPVALTPREMEVVRLLTEGLSNKEIALRLAVTSRTVNFHLDNLYGKLGVKSRTEAAIYALRQGWGSTLVE